MSTALADGQFDVKAPVLHTKELSLLGQTLTNMAHSLRERDTELAAKLPGP